MISNLNNKLNEFLNNEKIPKEYFDDLKNVANYTNFNKDIMSWFRFLQSFETIGWRNKLVTKKLCDIFLNNEPIQFYSLFCPSYLKGNEVVGFRTDDIGNTTKLGLKNLMKIAQKTRELGYKCNRPKAIFFDMALEQPKQTINMIDKLKCNIENFKKYIPRGMDFSLLSEEFPEVMDIIGYQGIVIDPLPIDESILKRIIERGKKFYKLFGWNLERIEERSKVIASSEAVVGAFLRNRMPNAIMIYTPTMLERAQVYSGKHQDKPLAIIIPERNYMVS